MLNTLLTNVRNAIEQTRRDERGATMIEYGLLVALIAVVVVPALLILGPAIVALFTGIAGNL
ncbi:Flp family type IVb pilin [Kribbella pratensis]|uniref:Pilus assembly protein Flp/PilA n=1 Tax=Kribbella pratensis TaxID=2512112 RepID=A0A4R8BZI3_9ACTN|nr:Flp family type IVb pilin [Kribbella pratensis]TDW66657.1 pilus assembly protein Flp/PilA [Kribbella pratensis]